MGRFKVGDLALARDGHVVKVVNLVREEGVEFAWVTYPGGFLPHAVGGRVAGTEDAPVWEHRVSTGNVLKSGGSYWNPDDWVREGGLRKLPATEAALNEAFGV